MAWTSYLEPDDFFQLTHPVALTYDDISLATHYSEVLPKETNLDVHLSETLSLHIPLISADMDTVTESEMAIAMALQGGMGLIHYNMEEKAQIRSVARVKNHIHGLIQEPIKVSPEGYIADVLDLIQRKNYGFRTFPVVDDQNKLLGLLTSRVVLERYKGKKIIESMEPRSNLHTILEEKISRNPIAIADAYFNEHVGVDKLLVIDKDDVLKGLFTLSDIDQIINEARISLKPARDSAFRLICGAAVPMHRTPEGELNKPQILNHVNNLVEEGVDAIAISTAHGYSKMVGEMAKLIHSAFKILTIIAGNVTTGEGVDFLVKAGANIIKVGQGPGSICTTRMVAGVGIPQLTALYETSKAAKKLGVTILADGGITKSGDIVKALTLGDAVVLGSLLAGCREAPGNIMEINGKIYKQYRGMGSLPAMKAGSSVRYGHAREDTYRKIAAEGIEALKEVSGNVDQTVMQLIGGVQSGMGYMGARNLKELKAKARYVRVTPAGYREAAPHDIIELKTLQGKEE